MKISIDYLEKVVGEEIDKALAETGMGQVHGAAGRGSRVTGKTKKASTELTNKKCGGGAVDQQGTQIPCCDYKRDDNSKTIKVPCCKKKHGSYSDRLCL